MWVLYQSGFAHHYGCDEPVKKVRCLRDTRDNLKQIVVCEDTTAEVWSWVELEEPVGNLHKNLRVNIGL